MHNRPLWLSITKGLFAFSVGIAGFAGAHTGGSGGHSGGGAHNGFHTGGFHGGGVRGGGGFRGGALYGYQHSGSGHPGGYYGHGWNRGGWGALRYGLYFSALPWVCDLYYWDGMPYYYSNDTFFEWNGSVGAYETVPPPTGLAHQVAAQAPVVTELFVFAKGSQTNEQMDRDRTECHRWAMAQAGLDPTKADDKSIAYASSTKRAKAEQVRTEKSTEYLRADGACLEARNYSVE